MPKLKTKRGIKKRFRITKSGKIHRARSGKSHLLTSKRKERKRRLRRAALVSKTQERMIKRMLPYG
ncbi:MAG: 50S ribosomal protein L35 [Omnitrophica WOR_2 bacterium RIFCSPHIGHO2_02_FULL_45_21]|nr:MAG: 50S ribosomal protein L35 [Omnitrophica WOR_2 bacterium RIFCSPHIGHO2_02_FULL_45_21]